MPVVNDAYLKGVVCHADMFLVGMAFFSGSGAAGENVGEKEIPRALHNRVDQRLDTSLR